jgi:hypothetical protein
MEYYIERGFVPFGGDVIFFSTWVDWHASVDVLLEFRFSQGITVRGSGGSTQWAKNAEKIYPISGCYVVKLISGAVLKRSNAHDSRIERKNFLIFSTIEQCDHFRCSFELTEKRGIVLRAPRMN